MDKKPNPFIPLESYKTQRVDIYINDLQTRLHKLRSKHDTIFVECCDILKKIQEVSSQTMTKQQEIGRIIKEFEDLGFKNSPQECSVLNKALIQKVGDVKRLREKFEKIFQVQLKRSADDINKNHSSVANASIAGDQKPATEEERDSVYFSTIDSLCSMPTNGTSESLCLEEEEVAQAMD